MPLSPETEKLRRILEGDHITPEIITISDSDGEGNNSQVTIASEEEATSQASTIDLSTVKKEHKNILKNSEVPSKRAKLYDRRRAVENNETRKANSQTQTELVLYSYSTLVQPMEQKKKKLDKTTQTARCCFKSDSCRGDCHLN